MFWKIAAFEFRYQMRQPVFWVGVFFFALLSFGLMCSPNVSLGGGGAIHKNAPWAVGLGSIAFTVWYMLVTTAFVANVVIRDDQTGFGPIVRSTPASKFDYLMGRFTGAFAAAAIGYLSVPIGMFVGSMMPWIDQQTLGPNDIGVYAYSYFALALPSVLLTSSLFFTVATVTRSMMWTYVGVIAFFVLNTILGVTLSRKPELQTLAAYIEPFGGGAFQLRHEILDGRQERNTGHPAARGRASVQPPDHDRRGADAAVPGLPPLPGGYARRQAEEGAEAAGVGVPGDRPARALGSAAQAGLRRRLAPGAVLETHQLRDGPGLQESGLCDPAGDRSRIVGGHSLRVRRSLRRASLSHHPQHGRGADVRADGNHGLRHRGLLRGRTGLA